MHPWQAQIGEEKRNGTSFKNRSGYQAVVARMIQTKSWLVKHLLWYLRLAYSILGKLILNMEALQKELAKIQVTAPDVNLLP